jgi:formylglycine-generating enzyme required for sulfatase activity
MGSNPSKFKGDKLPVKTVSWHDCVEFCNKRSIKEVLKPYYIMAI